MRKAKDYLLTPEFVVINTLLAFIILVMLVLTELLFSVFFRQLHLILSMLVHRDEDVKSESISNIEKEDISAIISIFQSIKCSEDICDSAKSKVEIFLVHSVFLFSFFEYIQ